MFSGNDSDDGEEGMEFDESSDDDDEEDGEDGHSSRWKVDLAERASSMFHSKQTHVSKLRALIYGQDMEEEANDEDELMGGLFRVVQKHSQTVAGSRRGGNVEESTKFTTPAKNTQLSAKEALRKRFEGLFVAKKTGDDEEDSKKAAMDGEKDEEVFGDFEDIESGRIFKSDISVKDDDVSYLFTTFDG